MVARSRRFSGLKAPIILSFVFGPAAFAAIVSLYAFIRASQQGAPGAWRFMLIFSIALIWIVGTAVSAIRKR